MSKNLTTSTGRMVMSKVFIEARQLAPERHISIDLARHIYMRAPEGVVIVVSDGRGMLSATVKQWKRLTVSAQTERSRTLKSRRIQVLNHQNKEMQNTHFISGTPDSAATQGIYFTSASRLAVIPSTCRTLYILDSLPDDEARGLTEKMPPDSLVVRYTPSA